MTSERGADWHPFAHPRDGRPMDRAAALRKLWVLANELAFSDDERHALTETFIRTDTPSWSTLTDEQMCRLIDAFEGHHYIAHLIATRPGAPHGIERPAKLDEKAALAALSEHGWRVRRIEYVERGRVAVGWTLLDADMRACGIGGHGAVAPTRWEAIVEGVRRLRDDGPLDHPT